MIEAGGQTSPSDSDDRNDHHCRIATDGLWCRSQHIRYIIHPMGRVVAGGLFAGTLLTLFFVPLALFIDR